MAMRYQLALFGGSTIINGVIRLFKQVMMGEAAKGLTAALVGVLIGFFATGKIGTTELEYKVGTKEAYFNIPQQVKNDLKLEHQGTPIANISIVDVAIYNRVKDIGPTTIYFRLSPKAAALPKLIAVDILPPDNLPNVGIAKEQSNDPLLYAFVFSTIKKQQHDESYRARFIFDGETAPDIQPTTTDKDVVVVPYKTSAEVLVIFFWVGLFYAVLFGGMWIWDVRTSLRRREKQILEFQDLVTQMHEHNDSRAQPSISLSNAVACFREFIQPKPGVFKELFNWLRAKFK